MDRLIPVEKASDISPGVQGTPVEALLRFHNLGDSHRAYHNAELLVGMCLDHRERLRIPENFAYILRAAGGNLQYSGFQISCAIAIGGVSTIVLIAHTQCGMVNLMSRRDQFIAGLVQRGGWQRERAEPHFLRSVPLFEIGNELDFLLAEARRLRLLYPKILVVPLMYRVEDKRLYHVREAAFDSLTANNPAIDPLLPKCREPEHHRTSSDVLAFGGVFPESRK